MGGGGGEGHGRVGRYLVYFAKALHFKIHELSSLKHIKSFAFMSFLAKLCLCPLCHQNAFASDAKRQETRKRSCLPSTGYF